MPGELVDAPGVTNRSAYAGSVRSSRVRGGAMPSRSNHVVSTLTHTSPTSIGVSRSPPSARTYCSAPGGRSAAYGANTPSSSGREAKVLSTPKATSPVGSSLVSESLAVRVPPSPAERVCRSMPVSDSKERTSFLGSANDEWVTSTTVPPTSPPASPDVGARRRLGGRVTAHRAAAGDGEQQHRRGGGCRADACARDLHRGLPIAGANRIRFGGSAVSRTLSTLACSPVCVPRTLR